jgi:hypothetical protein
MLYRVADDANAIFALDEQLAAARRAATARGIKSIERGRWRVVGDERTGI